MILACPGGAIRSQLECLISHLGDSATSNVSYVDFVSAPDAVPCGSML